VFIFIYFLDMIANKPLPAMKSKCLKTRAVKLQMWQTASPEVNLQRISRHIHGSTAGKFTGLQLPPSADRHAGVS
jgi:hypothetical protein